jgi:hypothetical protein
MSGLSMIIEQVLSAFRKQWKGSFGADLAGQRKTDSCFVYTVNLPALKELRVLRPQQTFILGAYKESALEWK